MKNIIPVYDIKDMENIVKNYSKTVDSMKLNGCNNNINFNNKLSEIINSM